MLGTNIGYPAGVVNRTKYNGDFQHGAQAWADFIAQEIQEDPKVEFSVHHEFNLADRSLTFEIEGISKANLTGEVRLSVMITEDNIVDAQDDLEAGGIVDDYIHKDVLRGMATPFNGTPISDGLGLGQSFSGSAGMELDPTWDERECNALIIISEVRSNDDIKVLQAAEVHIVE